MGWCSMVSLPAKAQSEITGTWEGLKLSGRTNLWDLFGPFEINYTGGELAVWYKGSLAGSSDHKMKTASYKSGKLKCQWHSWQGWLFEATLSAKGELEGYLHHHGMAEKFSLQKHSYRPDSEVIASFKSGSRVPPPQSQFIRILLTEPDNGLMIYEKVKQANKSYVLFNNSTLNEKGYDMLEVGRTDLAIVVLQLNAREYPDDPNVYDSLGEAYVKAGKRDLAISALRKCLSMNPIERVRDNSIRLLKQLGINYAGKKI